MDDRFFSLLVSEISSRVIKGLQIEGRASAPASNGAATIHPRLLTIDQASIVMGRTRRAVEHLINRRELVVVRKGRRVHVDIDTINEFIERNKT